MKQTIAFLGVFLLEVTLASTSTSRGASAPTNLPPDYATFQRVSFSMHETGIVQMKCEGGLTGQCMSRREERAFSGPTGSLEIAEDSQITDDIRDQIRGCGGAAIRGKNALVVLRDQSNAVVAALELERPLAQLRDPIFISPNVRTYVLAVDYSACTAESGVVGYFVDADLDHKRLELERYSRPQPASEIRPNGIKRDLGFGNDGPMNIVSRGSFELLTIAGSLEVHQTWCFHDGINLDTGDFDFQTATAHEIAQFRGGIWRQELRIAFEGCDF